MLNVTYRLDKNDKNRHGKKKKKYLTGYKYDIS